MSNLKGKRFIPSSTCFGILWGLAILAGFYIISQYNYLLFHSLVEIIAVIVACAVFIRPLEYAPVSG